MIDLPEVAVKACHARPGPTVAHAKCPKWRNWLIAAAGGRPGSVRAEDDESRNPGGPAAEAP